METCKLLRRFFLLSLWWLFSLKSFGQSKYWIFFTDKPSAVAGQRLVSDQTLQNRRMLGLPLWQYSDVAVSKSYIHLVSEVSGAIINQSKWLNGVTAYLAPDQVAALSKLPFVKSIRKIKGKAIAANNGEIPDLDTLGLTQVNGQAFRQQRLTGKKVLIGVIDGRFASADHSKELQHIFATNRVKHTRDFIQRDGQQLYKEESLEDWHGTVVWQRIAGVDPAKRTTYGLAPDADFCLARVDDSKVEARADEDHWIAAIEWMDSLGVRLVNSALGYSLDHDNPIEDYKREEMNGQTSGVAKAAQIAAQQKGMILVVAAGNEGGNKNWGIVVTPGDAEGVVTVGATVGNLWLKPMYSAIGPEFLQFLKPNVACYTPNGTSLATPVITGLIACMLEKKPALTGRQVKELVEKSGHLYPYGNNYLGYGVPDAARLLKLIDNPDYQFGTAETMRYKVDRLNEFRQEDNKIVLVGERYTSSPVVLFHKKDAKTVVFQAVRSAKRKKLIIERPDNVTTTTVSSKAGVLEINW